MGLNYGYFWSDLRFDSKLDVAIDRRGVTGTVELRPTPRMTLQLGAGAVFAGHLDTVGTRHELGPGWLAALAFTYQLLDGREDRPFLLLSGSLGASGARTRQELPVRADAESFLAIDARAGAVVGKTLWRTLSPYAGARVFAGPVFWRFQGEDRTGTDRYHYQLALGLLASLPKSVDLYAEIAPLGERAVAVGGGFAF